MKPLFTAIVIITITLFFIVPFKVAAQTEATIIVPASPIGNINDFIMGDTTSTGARAHPNAIYTLYRDSLYFFTNQMDVNFNLNLVAASGTGALPVLVPAINPDNSRPNHFINLQSGNLSLKHLYIFGIAPDDVPPSTGRAIVIAGDSMDVKIDSCIFDGWTEAALWDQGLWNSFWLTDNLFRNIQDYVSYYWGDSFFNYKAPCDTVVMLNNTMFCDEGYAYALTDYNNYTDFEHNTIFLEGGQVMFLSAITNGIFSNNIFYGVNVEGGLPIMSMSTLGTIGAKYNITEAQRHLKIDNNDYFWPQSMQSFWQQYSLQGPTWFDSTVTGMFQDTVFQADTLISVNNNLVKTDTGFIYAYDTSFASTNTIQRSDTTFVINITKLDKWHPHFETSGNLNVDPGFSSAFTAQSDSLLQYVYLSKTGGLGFYLWSYVPSGSAFPPTQPIPENLVYTNTSLQHAGTDGYALGDLNWYPSQHQAWLNGVTGVETAKSNLPTGYGLNQNYPNPFNPSTIISYSIPRESNVALKVYNVLGQEVSTLVNKMQSAGNYSVSFDASRLSSGVYFYTIKAGSFMQVKKMMLLK